MKKNFSEFIFWKHSDFFEKPQLEKSPKKSPSLHCFSFQFSFTDMDIRKLYICTFPWIWPETLGKLFVSFIPTVWLAVHRSVGLSTWVGGLLRSSVHSIELSGLLFTKFSRVPYQSLKLERPLSYYCVDPHVDVVWRLSINWDLVIHYTVFANAPG